jgi:hypothetical protein
LTDECQCEQCQRKPEKVTFIIDALRVSPTPESLFVFSNGPDQFVLRFRLNNEFQDHLLTRDALEVLIGRLIAIRSDL